MLPDNEQNLIVQPQSGYQTRKLTVLSPSKYYTNKFDSESSVRKQYPKQHRFDIMSKLIIIGDSGVGKTNIMMRFCQNMFKDNHVATIGVDFNVKMMHIEDTIIKMQVWDTAGQQRFKTITETYYKGAGGIIFVYSVDSKLSFDSISNTIFNSGKWVQKVNEKVPTSVPKVLVANKIDLYGQQSGSSQVCDLADQPLQLESKYCSDQHGQCGQHQRSLREVSTKEGQQLAKQLEMQYLQVSAKQNTQVYDIFYTVGKKIREQHMETHSMQMSGRRSRVIMTGSHYNQYFENDNIVKLWENQQNSKGCAC